MICLMLWLALVHLLAWPLHVLQCLQCAVRGAGCTSATGATDQLHTWWGQPVAQADATGPACWLAALLADRCPSVPLQLWWVYRGVEGSGQELWHGTQMWFWMAPNHLRAIWRVTVAQLPGIRWLLAREVRSGRGRQELVGPNA